jgi:hypothetical protein
LFVNNTNQSKDKDNQHTTNTDPEMRIRVIVRKRPMTTSESNINNSGDIDIIHPLDYNTYGRILVYQPKTRVDLTKQIDIVPFAFDNVFNESSTNQSIYIRSIRNLIPSFFIGQWASIFAYGQTGSGVRLILNILLFYFSFSTIFSQNIFFLDYISCRKHLQ